MSAAQLALVKPKPVRKPVCRHGITLPPPLAGVATARLAPSPGWQQQAWYGFGIFAMVITGLVIERIPAVPVGPRGVAVRRGAGSVHPFQHRARQRDAVGVPWLVSTE
jgi:hypothetical protein